LATDLDPTTATPTGGAKRSQPLRIAFLTTEYPSDAFFAGGLATYVRRTSRLLVEADHEVEVFSLAAEDDEMRDGDVPVHFVSGKNAIIRSLASKPVIWRYQHYGQILGPALNLYRAFKRRQRKRSFDLVQVANSQACGLLTAIRARVPVITRISSFEPNWRRAYSKPLTEFQKAREKAEIWQLRRSTRVYSPSRLIADTLRDSHGLSVDLVEPPFDPPRVNVDRPLRPPGIEPEGYALFFGSIGVLKGCDRLVDVLAELLPSCPDMKFVFAGPVKQAPDGSPCDQYIRERLARYADRVVVLAEQPHEELFPLVAQARFVVLPSRVDNLPNAAMEAMSLRRVVIGTRGASFDQLIRHGESGWLVSQQDDAELLRCMHQAWDTPPERREAMGRQAAAAIQRMHPQQAIARLIDYYEETLAAR